MKNIHLILVVILSFALLTDRTGADGNELKEKFAALIPIDQLIDIYIDNVENNPTVKEFAAFIKGEHFSNSIMRLKGVPSICAVSL